MADAIDFGTEICVERAMRSVHDLRCVRNNNALENRAQITHRFDCGLRHWHWGVSNPPGRPRDGSRRRAGGCSRPRSINDAG